MDCYTVVCLSENKKKIGQEKCFVLQRGQLLSVELSSVEWVVVDSIPAIGPIKGLKIKLKKLLPLSCKCLHLCMVQLSAFVLETFALCISNFFLFGYNILS